MHPDNIGKQMKQLYHWGPNKVSVGEVIRPSLSLRESAVLMDEGMREDKNDDFCEHGGSHDHIDPTPLAWASPDKTYYKQKGLVLHKVEPVNAHSVIFSPHEDGVPEVASKDGFRVVGHE